LKSADPAQQNDVSDNESEALRLLRRGRVGAAHVRLHKGLYWEIDFSFPGGLKCGRKRYYRRSASAAYRTAIQKTKEFREHGKLAGQLTTGQRWVAAECFRITAELYGEDPAVLLNILREHRDRHPKAGNARTIDEVRIEIVAKKRRGERRERYVRDFDYKMRCLAKALGNAPISSVTSLMLEKELARHSDWASGTVHSVVQAWKVIFNYAVKYGYCLTNPCVNLELPRKRKAKPEVLSAIQVHRLLAACITDETMKCCLAYVAIGCFTGIRPEEMQRLRWEMFNFDAGLITIDGEDSKCGERGIVKMSANLVSWLKPVAKASGRVLREPVAKLRTRCRVHLGLTRWPHDCMRHSFASYHYTAHRDIGEVCSQLRHGTGQIVFINHYYVVRSPAEAHYFWRIVRPVGLLTA
jgi:integrase/recombinase XerD